MRERLEIGGKVLTINGEDCLKIITIPPDPFKVLHGTFNVKKGSLIPLLENGLVFAYVVQTEDKNRGGTSNKAYHMVFHLPFQKSI